MNMRQQSVLEKRSAVDTYIDSTARVKERLNEDEASSRSVEREYLCGVNRQDRQNTSPRRCMCLALSDVR